ncbi:hypothetical protein ASG31_14700 [Chryseobacterium sp. Leaf404]|uniref:glycosyltransferase n=1 Tax=unclassified Chryseobacterium TaxID=2593645 RepID=UPI0007003D94|nr:MULTISPECIES: glycosyltransferase [unclassified Chryseobacterium]KQT15508.1 hypothetical protein ASG31_14700 [Chryseobacterium sp. Leaf404]
MTTTSIAICTYNGEKYLAEQLESILSQTVKADEIVVCDDGSKDKTTEILQEYQLKNPGLFKIMVNETNLGYFKNFEKAIYACKGDIIITSDQDDIWEINKIEVTKDFFDKNPDYDGVFNDLEIINNDYQINEPSYLNWKHISYKFLEENIINNTLFVQQQIMGSFVLGCALAVKRSALQQYGLSNFEIAHDYFIAQKLSAKGRLGFIPQTLSKYRQHEDQVCGLREAMENTPKIKGDNEKSYFQSLVGPFLLAIRKYRLLYPDENVQSTPLYRIFLENRNTYLQSLSFLKRKKYILQCIRHHYLDLHFTDFFKY